jgi:tetratricopeptide (TPR) repeat protein
VVQVGAQSMADRYAYASFWGPTIALVWGATSLAAAAPPVLRAGLAAGAALVLATLGFLSHRQAACWHDTLSLFEDAVADTEGNWLAHRSLAAHYFEREDYAKALEHCEKGVALGRDLGTLLGTCGLALYESGRPELAIRQLEEAIRIAPENPIGYMNLGWIRAERGEYEDAAALLETAAGKLPATPTTDAYLTVYANWGRALASLGRGAEAREKYELALARDPDAAFALRDLAQLDLQGGDPSRAAARLERALALDPADAKARYVLATAHALRGDLDAAAATLVALAELASEASGAAPQLAATLLRLGREEDAARLLAKTRDAAGRSASPGARAAVAAIEAQLARAPGED